MGITKDLDEMRNKIDPTQSPLNYVEVAATMMPKRMVGLKHMFRPACRFLPMPMSLGWQENPVDDDYPQRLLVNDLRLTDIDSGATRTVIAPWMHALYTMTHEELPNGVMEVKLEEAQFTSTFTWQHLAVICVIFTQAVLGFWAIAHHQPREGALILLGIFLQFMEGYYAWKFPTYRPPRSVARARNYVLHKGMTTTHFLLISHHPNQSRPANDNPYLSLEDAAVPMRVLRKGYRRIFETTFRVSLQIGNMALRLGGVLSPANGLLVSLTFLFGTIASEIITMIRTPLPQVSFMEPLETAERRMSILDMVTAICQKTGCISIGFVEAALPDPDGTHVDFQWLSKILESENTLAAGVHPRHQTANDVFRQALQRRTRTQPSA
ncbi:hypothetical protein D9756_009806 [Leucocoprinus leucothites]|uniref:Uncharacterized protein n=1 Tax=Leucocoprinus leucothites TaxID=201217 RepID=A0A8H5CWV0_9AGAR|nr:hypothetical protein D9756_009806 [Leucoagaricus leucothites]